MDVEPQYPVDAATRDAMQDGGDVSAPPDATEAANLDEYMRESGGVKTSRGGRGGRGPGGERLKVRAVIVKRTSGPTSGGRGGRGRGPSGGAPKKRERVFKRDDGFVAVRIYGKDVVLVSPTGEVRLDCGGDTGHNTYRAVNENLNKFGFKLTKDLNDETRWTLGDGKRFLKRYEDGMVIPAPVPPGPGRALALMQRDDEFSRASTNAGGGRDFGRGFGFFGGRGAGRGRGMGRGRY